MHGSITWPGDGPAKAFVEQVMVIYRICLVHNAPKMSIVVIKMQNVCIRVPIYFFIFFSVAVSGFNDAAEQLCFRLHSMMSRKVGFFCTRFR